MKDKGRIVVLGIDALNQTLLKKGYFPNLSAFMSDSVSGTLKSVHPPSTDAAWTSFQTGVKPERHGICNFVDFREEKQPLHTKEDITHPTFYDIFEEESIPQLIFNLPFSYPPSISGDIVYSWVDHGFSEGDFTHPSELKKRFSSLEDLQLFPSTSGSSVKRLKKLEEYFSERKKVITEIISESDYGFYFFLISVTDWIQHVAYEKIVSDEDSEEKMISQRIMEQVDQLFKLIFDYLDLSKDTLIIMSDHGFTKYDNTFYVNTWLKEEGYLTLSKEGKKFSDIMRRRVNKGDKSYNIGKLGRWLKEHPTVRKRLSFLEGFVRNKLNIEISTEKGIDLEKSRAICFSKLARTIYINPDVKDKEGLKNEMISELNKIDQINAMPVKKVYNNEKIGDVLIDYKNGAISNEITEKVFWKKGTTGHDYNGVFAMEGPAFLGDAEGNLNIYDLFPILLYLKGCEIPRSIDGKLDEDLFNDKYLRAHPIEKRDIEKEKIDRNIKEIT